MRCSIDEAIFKQFPNFRRVVVLAADLDNRGQHPELVELLRAAEERARGGAMADFPNLPRLAIWAEAFQYLGINPKKNPPSVINLIKRVRGGKSLPYVNSLVAIFNCLSLEHQLSCGGDDLGVVRGDLLLTLAGGDENYSPLGRPDQREHPAPGEVIYMDTGTREVFCRAWCWKNGDVSKLTEATARAAINLDALLPTFSLIQLEDLGHRMAELVSRFTGARTAIRVLTPERPEFIIDDAYSMR